MLKQTNYEFRNLFLELFMKELILNSKPKLAEEKPVEEGEKEKVEEKKAEKKETTKPIEIKEKYLPSPKIIPSETSILPKPKKPLFHLPRKIQKTIFKQTAHAKQPISPQVKTQQFKIPLKKRYTMHVSVTAGQPQFSLSLPLSRAIGEVNLGDLNTLLADNEITVIECPGPDKFILVKKAGRVNLTKMKLTQKEIDEIIENFSERTRIPIIGGVFKASVGNLTISAVISGFVGSRFIIYRAIPYSIIEKQFQQTGQPFSP